MGIDVQRLKETVAGRNTTLEAVAMILGIDRSTLYRKLKRGKTGLTVYDAQKISSFLGLSLDESLAIFWRQ